jgi:hypothetical protein
MAWSLSILLVAGTTALGSPPTVPVGPPDTLETTLSVAGRLHPSAASLAVFTPLLRTAAPNPPAISGVPTGPSRSRQAGVDDPAPQLVEYSDAYFTRLTIHRWASYATLPLFAAEWYLGNQLFNGTASSSTRGAHGAVAAGLGVLFAVNTVTGGLNLWEGRKDPEGRTLRTVHGVLMLLADAGFAAAGATAPETERGFTSGNRSRHRTIGIASILTATASYLIMIPPFRRD